MQCLLQLFLVHIALQGQLLKVLLVSEGGLRNLVSLNSFESFLHSCPVRALLQEMPVNGLIELLLGDLRVALQQSPGQRLHLLLFVVPHLLLLLLVEIHASHVDVVAQLLSQLLERARIAISPPVQARLLSNRYCPLLVLLLAHASSQLLLP